MRNYTKDQIEIAASALYELNYENKISDKVLKLAERNGISLARLHAMTIFLETKGPPKQFMNS